MNIQLYFFHTCWKLSKMFTLDSLKLLSHKHGRNLIVGTFQNVHISYLSSCWVVNMAVIWLYKCGAVRRYPSRKIGSLLACLLPLYDSPRGVLPTTPICVQPKFPTKIYVLKKFAPDQNLRDISAIFLERIYSNWAIQIQLMKEMQ